MRKFVLLVTLFLMGVLLYPSLGHAEKSMGFSVKANIPENQIDKTLTYFDLKMEPNQKQEITLTVSNSGEEKATIIISPNIAMTNQNGVIDYSKGKGKIDSSLKNPITSIISKEQEVTLEPKETKEVPFTLKMPAEKFDGVILGGFYISKKEDGEISKEKEKDVQIKNKYSYVIGLQLRENTNEVKPVVKLNHIKPALLNYRTSVTANLQNTKATIIRDLTINAKVMKKGSSKILHETSKKNLSMAPNSNFDFPINWDNKSLDPGTYTLNMLAQSGSDKWEFTKDFKISSKESGNLNKEAVELEKSEPNWFLIIGLVAGSVVLLILVIIFFIYRYQKKKAAEKRALLMRQRKRKKNKELQKRKNSVEKNNKKEQKSKYK